MYTRVSDSNRNSWRSNIEYYSIKYSNSSNISNSLNTGKFHVKKPIIFTNFSIFQGWVNQLLQQALVVTFLRYSWTLIYYYHWDILNEIKTCVFVTFNWVAFRKHHFWQMLIFHQFYKRNRLLYTVRHSYHYNFELAIHPSFTNQNETKLGFRDTLGCNLSNDAQLSNFACPILLIKSTLWQRSEIAYAHVTFFAHSAIHFWHFPD